MGKGESVAPRLIRGGECLSYKSPWIRDVVEVSQFCEARTAICHRVTAHHAVYLVSFRPDTRGPSGDRAEERLEN